MQILFLFSLIAIQSAQNVYTKKKNNNATIPVISEGEVDYNFQDTTIQQTMCHPSRLYGLGAESESSEFFIHTGDSPLTLNIKGNADLEVVKIKIGEFEKKMKPNTSINFTIQYECQQEKIQKEVTWSLITLEFEFNNTSRLVNYFKLCNQPESYSHPLLILLMLAISLVGVGSQYGLKELRVFGNVQQEQFGIASTIFFIFSTSCLLVLLFNFPEIGQAILMVFIIFIAFVALETVILDILNLVSSQARLNWILAYGSSFSLIASYWYTRNWFVSNLLTLAIALLMFRVIEMDNLRTGTILLLLAFCYDIFWVFLSPYLFGQSVMATVATQIDLPMKFMCPSLIPSKNTPLFKCSLLGLGDILLPGILVKFVLKFEVLLGRGAKIFIASLLGYSIGLTLCIESLLIYNQPQPALLYIVPCLLLSIYSMALKQGVFLQLWRGEIFRRNTSAPRLEHAYELTGEQL